MEESNIDDFDKTVGVILATLYQSFPIRTVIEPSIVHEPSQSDPTIEGWDNRYFHQQSIFKYTMSWLIQAGYIWYEKQDGVPELSGIFKDCVLSTKGLEILKTPDSLSGKSIGAQLQSAAKDGVFSSVKSLTEKALGIGAKMAYSSAAAWVAS